MPGSWRPQQQVIAEYKTCLGAAHGRVVLAEVLLQDEVCDVRRQVAHKDRVICGPGQGFRQHSKTSVGNPVQPELGAKIEQGRDVANL